MPALLHLLCTPRQETGGWGQSHTGLTPDFVDEVPEAEDEVIEGKAEVVAEEEEMEEEMEEEGDQDSSGQGNCDEKESWYSSEE